MARLIRVTSLPASRRRAGFAFTREPLTLGRESFADGISGLIQLAALVSDPGLAVERSDEDTPDLFIPITDEERAAVVDIARAAELEADSEDAAQAFERILEGLVGGADDDADDEHARSLEAKRLADDAEERRLADEAEAKRLAEAAAANSPPPAPGATVEVAPGVTAPVSTGTEVKEEPKKGDAAPTKAKAKADAKPQGSSGRQSKPANTTAAKD